MRQMIFLLVFCTPFVVHAYGCPSYLADNKKAQTMYDWLEKYTGQFELHGCQVEILVCDPAASGVDEAPIAEIYIVTKEGREAYLSVDFPKKPTWRYRTKVREYKRTIVYKKRDRYYEPTEGRTEHWQLEMTTDWNNKSDLDYIELGIYSTNRQLNQANGNDSRWYLCSNRKPIEARSWIDRVFGL